MRLMRSWLPICVAVLSIGVLAGCAELRAQAPLGRHAEPSRAASASSAAASRASLVASSEPLPTVYFTSMAGCESCDVLRPTVRELAKQYAGKIKLVTLDMSTQRGEQQAAKLGVRGYPVLVLHDRHGKELLRMFGVPSQDRVQRGFALLAKAN